MTVLWPSSGEHIEVLRVLNFRRLGSNEETRFHLYISLQTVDKSQGCRTIALNVIMRSENNLWLEIFIHHNIMPTAATQRPCDTNHMTSNSAHVAADNGVH
jgi:hypothetical protein